LVLAGTSVFCDVTQQNQSLFSVTGGDTKGLHIQKSGKKILELDKYVSNPP
jgi:hypothetical protein